MDHEGQSRTANLSIPIIAFSLVLGGLFDYLILEKMPGISFPIFIATLLVGLFGLIHAARKPVRRDLYWLGLAILFFSLMVAVRANPLLTALNMIGSLLLLCLMALVQARGSIMGFTPTEYFKVLVPPILFFNSFMTTVRGSLSQGMLYRNHKNRTQVVRGIIITIPIIIILALLLSAADPIFSQLASLFNITIPDDAPIKSIAALIIAMVSAGAYSYGLSSPDPRLQQSTARNLGRIEVSILLGAINALFLLFIIFQVSYLFGGESNILVHGMTYAEYARKGFFELVAVAVISCIILLVTEKNIERHFEEHSRTFKLLSSVLVLQVMILMLSAFERLSLYESMYGFTTLRLYVHAFILFLAAVFAFLAYKIIFNGTENLFALRVFLAILVFVAGMNLLNPDAFIAQKNLNRYAATGKLDAPYLASLSSDAAAQQFEALQIDTAEIRNGIGMPIYYAYKNLSQAPWQSWNLSRQNAQKMFEEHQEILKAYSSTSISLPSNQ